ncbi:exported protein of unknown function [Acetoanaerobium sticklandii]|uniref:Copper amine oxidase-like N-terminal domain-containing protein n=1 Tax=Acetoanaerobium sticklandii (strain ATCC 12662 / DSM 519 / JCM 1433 / CCUG 9281 / NCIMB 10654 / HF) TaxID=499177 RepID=E3PUZ7_ACESD|nr:hypothetical protein [Acetoanaerobium sticklandii]CBH20477.1 exported protein of unknown function [Acetoanaerobium sticklandii]
MKLFSSKKKIAIIGTMLTTMLAGTIAYAATPIKQDAYYDTFKLVVNGTEQFISDTALKPFIANSRVYVPISTLQNLGIANVQWTPAATGQAASLSVTPKGGTASGEVALYQQQLAALNTQLQAKESEITTLKADKTKLEAEVDKLKSSSSSSSGDLSTRDLQDLEDILNDDRDFEEFYVDSTIRDIGFTYEVDEYRGDVEINMYPDIEITSSILSTLKTDSVARAFDSFIEDIGEEAERKFKDSDVIINLYDDRERNRPSEIHSFDYDGRLRDTIKDAR